MYKWSSVVLFLFLKVVLCTGQDQGDYEVFYDVILSDDHTIEKEKMPVKYKIVDSEFKLLANALHTGYKTFLSDQDGQTCSFHPSCSTYMLRSVHRTGMIGGVIKGLDRLTRCNGFSPEKYEIDWKRKKFYDPVH